MSDDKGSFKDHSGTHNSLFKCHFCEKFLSRARSLKHHITNVHEGIHLLKCTYPNCTFGTNMEEEMKEHSLKHTDEEINKSHMKVEHIKSDPELNISKVEQIRSTPEHEEKG